MVKSIPKRSVGYRKLQIPQGYLKVIQLKILREILDKAVVGDYLYAFEAGRNVTEKAAKHVGKEYVVSMDIKDFFPSVKIMQVKAAFVALGQDDDKAALLAELCTYKFFLPQGAVTSPKISNLITQSTFGPELVALAAEHNFTLTVYADDVTFSFNVPEAEKEREVEYVNGLVNLAKTAIERHGFKVHKHGKLKVMHKDFRQEVCGIVVNEKTSVKRDQRRKLRAMVHTIAVKKGTAFDGPVNLNTSQVMGKISWYANFSPKQAEALKEQLK